MAIAFYRLCDRKFLGVSPIVATIILVAIVIAVAIAVTMWGSGIVGVFTRHVELEIPYTISRSSVIGGPCEITVYVKNTGPTATGIDLVVVEPASVGGEWNYTSDSWVRVGELAPEPYILDSGKDVVIVIRNVNARPGQVLHIVLHTTHGVEFHKYVKVELGGGLLLVACQGSITMGSVFEYRENELVPTGERLPSSAVLSDSGTIRLDLGPHSEAQKVLTKSASLICSTRPYIYDKSKDVFVSYIIPINTSFSEYSFHFTTDEIKLTAETKVKIYVNGEQVVFTPPYRPSASEFFYWSRRQHYTVYDFSFRDPIFGDPCVCDAVMIDEQVYKVKRGITCSLSGKSCSFPKNIRRYLVEHDLNPYGRPWPCTCRHGSHTYGSHYYKIL